ncbi:MAG: D-alanyl-D-alanine carboxypeptidase [Candidatus Parcubacteria bacterium]
MQYIVATSMLCMATSAYAEITDSLKLPKNTVLMQGDVTLLGAQNGDWIQFLESRCGGRSCGRMRQLNPQFGQRIMAALKAAEQQTGTRARINDSFRSVQEQAAAYARYQNGGGLAAPPGRSYHGRGLAVDVGPAAIYNKLHQIGPQFGVFNPPTIRAKDPVHFQMGNCDAACQAQSPSGNDQAQQNQQGPAAQGGDPTGGDHPQGNPNQQSNQSNQSNAPAFGDTQQKPLDVPQGAPVNTEGDIELTCIPASVPLGEALTITWKCPAATESRASAKPTIAFDTKRKTSGSVAVKPRDKTTFSMACVKANKVIAKAHCVVPVVKQKKILVVRLSAYPKEVRPGERVELEWTTQNAKQCTLTGPGVSSSDLSGRITTEPLSADTEFRLTCTGILKDKKTKTAHIRFFDTTNNSPVGPVDAL